MLDGLGADICEPILIKVSLIIVSLKKCTILILENKKLLFYIERYVQKGY